jgi:hypothetical protein
MTASAAALTWRSPRTVLWMVAATLLVVLNVYLFTLTDWTMLRGGAGADWTIFGEAGRRAVEGGALYAVEDNYAFRYSPLLAYLLWAIAPVGALAWRALHVVAVGALALHDRRLALLTLISWPFWFDVEAGNLMTFVLVISAFALAGRRWAIAVYLVAAILIPRPLMLPIAVWLLWHHREWRWPFVGAFLAHAILVALSGWGAAWVASLIGSSAEMASVLNFGPSRLFGWLWVPIGLAAAAILTWRGRLGWAALAASPYWLPYYFLMPLLELTRTRAEGLGATK